MRRAEIVAAVGECGERCEARCGRAGRDRDHTVWTGEDFKRLGTREDERDVIGDCIHRSPRCAIVVGLGAAGKVLRFGLRVAEGDDGFRTIEVGLGR